MLSDQTSLGAVNLDYKMYFICACLSCLNNLVLTFKELIHLVSYIPEYCMSGYIDSSGMEERTAIDCSRSFWITANKEKKKLLHIVYVF